MRTDVAEISYVHSVAPVADPADRWSTSRVPLIAQPADPTCEVSVVIPVRDEAATLEGALAALAEQADGSGGLLDRGSYEILLLANNCLDDSASLARSFARRHHDLRLHVVELQLPPAQAHVGRARQLLMDEAYWRFIRRGRPRGVIASTDGDTRVAPSWLAATLGEIDRGADAVGGRILADPIGLAALGRDARSRYLRDVAYQHLVSQLESVLDPDPNDPWPRHSQHTGASLAVTADLYQRAGGLPALAVSEDVALHRALVRAGARFRHSPLVRVVTSARRHGRAPGGMATQLEVWSRLETTQTPHLVNSIPWIEHHLVGRRRLRTVWHAARSGAESGFHAIATVAAHYGVSPQALANDLAHGGPWGWLVERVEQRQRVEGAQTAPRRLVDIADAIRDARVRLADLRRARSAG